MHQERRRHDSAMRRRWRSIGALGVLALVAGPMAGLACSSKGTASSARTQAVAWNPGKVTTANGRPPALSAEGACGSASDTYLTELLHVSPTQSKVGHEWGDIVKGGKQVAVSGSVATTHLGPTDLPMSHPFGDDLSMDVALDAPFPAFAKSLGPSESHTGEMRVTTSSGI